ncbi:MAG: hypothetical protein CMC89_05115 [Flavobacteriaceae bacterium]|nr:hypothetical protein [Flavobacteriaceae bacterium]|tara:strand:- start:3862 stop:4404 length:543 start_codon:yes stop_codon:yes gene_type:complete
MCSGGSENPYERVFSQLNTGVQSQVGQVFDPNFNPYANINTRVATGRNASKRPADDLFAELIRAQTDDYTTRFAPIERDLASRVTSTGTTSLSGDLMRTGDAITTAAQNAAGQQRRGLERFGLTSDSNIGQDNSYISSLVGGFNDTIRRDEDRRQAIIGGGIGNISSTARARTRGGGGYA